MIEPARARETKRPLGIEYQVLDARRLGSAFAPESFTLAVACMSLMDMPDLSKVLRGVHRVLRPNARLVISITHPVNTAEVGWERSADGTIAGVRIDRYFEEKSDVTRGEMKRLTRPFSTPYWHRPLEAWFTLLQSSGFRVEQLREPHATQRAIADVPLLESTGRIPFFLVLVGQRGPHRAGPPTARVRAAGSVP